MLRSAFPPGLQELKLDLRRLRQVVPKHPYLCAESFVCPMGSHSLREVLLR